MTTKIDIETADKFYEEAMLNKKHDPWLIKRKPEGHYAFVRIIDCQNPMWWYKDFIGFEFFAEIRYRNYGHGKYIHEFIAVQLHNTTKNTGRSICAKDGIIV